MGSIHPRLKFPVGRRLAASAARIIYNIKDMPATGPTISSCTVNSNLTLIINFNASMLGDDAIEVRAFDVNLSHWAESDSAALHVCFGSNAKEVAACRDDPTMWLPVSANQAKTSAISADLSSAAKGNVPLAVRYGWGLDDSTCCPTKDSVNGWAPCYPGRCPLYAASSGLPANSFYAEIHDGACVCDAPQMC